MSSVQALTARELLPFVLEPSWADVGLADDQLLVLALGPDNLADSERADLIRWLRAQPVPIIGFGPEPSPFKPGVDLVARSDEELAAVVESVQRNPRAAAVLVQVLRAVQELEIAQALAIESLGYSTLQSGAEFEAWLSAQRQARPARTVPARDDMVLLSRDGPRLEIVLNSPESRNSLSVAMRDALTDAFKLVAIDHSIEMVDVRGIGPCFSAGGDLGEFGSLVDPLDAHHVRMLGMPARYLAARAGSFRFHLHGACIGAGIELPAFAGHVTATADAFFQLPEVGMGLIPGAGGCVSITRRIGRHRTARMALMGDRVSAATALDWGLIDALDD